MSLELHCTWPFANFLGHQRSIRKTEERCAALSNGENDCISASHWDADLWIRVWNKIGEWVNEEVDLRLLKVETFRH